MRGEESWEEFAGTNCGGGSDYCLSVGPHFTCSWHAPFFHSQRIRSPNWTVRYCMQLHLMSRLQTKLWQKFRHVGRKLANAGREFLPYFALQLWHCGSVVRRPWLPCPSAVCHSGNGGKLSNSWVYGLTWLCLATENIPFVLHKDRKHTNWLIHSDFGRSILYFSVFLLMRA